LASCYDYDSLAKATKTLKVVILRVNDCFASLLYTHPTSAGARSAVKIRYGPADVCYMELYDALMYF